ncbi:MAG: hypothetical protein R2777_01510 [Chitinophagales bacterium]
MKQIVILFLLTALLFATSCKKDRLYSGSDEVLKFSADTLTFDTVFTSVGSITRYFKVENTLKETVKLDKVELMGLPGTQFRINVDGEPGRIIENIEIPAKDYIYIFAEVTVDPNNQNNPFVLLDEIEYHYNGIVQKSYLRAWGQNAYFHYGEVITGDSIWNNDKPHVVVRNDSFPGVGIESFGSLQIKAGCKVYFTAGSGIFSDGPLTIGEPNCMDSVVLQSDRIEDLPNGLIYDDMKGLWLGIVLRNGATGTFHNTIINNATYGILGRWIFDDFSTFSQSNQPQLVLDKVKIKNTSNTALFCLNANVECNNSIFYSAGNGLATLAMGGNYDFTNCTFYGTGEQAAVALSNYASNGTQGGYGNLTAANFTNCIIYGSKNDEFSINNDDIADFNFDLKNCLVKTSLNTDTSTYTNCIFNQNPQFENTQEGNFHLRDNSPCIATGTNSTYLYDYYCNLHNNPFDIGAILY